MAFLGLANFVQLKLSCDYDVQDGHDDDAQEAETFPHHFVVIEDGPCWLTRNNTCTFLKPANLQSKSTLLEIV